MNGERLTTWWVARYTRGLPDNIRADRSAEIASDLWEHRTSVGGGSTAQLTVLSRCIRGVPADLSWRRMQRNPGRRRLPARGSVLRMSRWAPAVVSYLLLVGMHGYNATALLGLDLYGADWPEGDVVFFARVSSALLAALVAGIILLRPLPRIGAALLAAGALGTALMGFPCLALLFGPLGIAVAAGGIVAARRRRPARKWPTSAGH